MRNLIIAIVSIVILVVAILLLRKVIAKEETETEEGGGGSTSDRWCIWCMTSYLQWWEVDCRYNTEEANEVLANLNVLIAGGWNCEKRLME